MELILEASYREFMKLYRKGYPFAIISAFRGDLDKKTNVGNNKTLRKYIASEGYSMLRVSAHYEEDYSYQESMIVFYTPDKESEFLRFVLYFGKKFYQNGIVFVDSNSDIWLYSTRSNSTYGSSGSRLKLDKFIFSDIDKLLDTFSRRTYEVDSVRIITD